MEESNEFSIARDLDAWFAALDQFAKIPFLEDGRQQPSMPAIEGPLTYDRFHEGGE